MESISTTIFQPNDQPPKLPEHIQQQLDQLAQTWGISRIFKERMPFLYAKEYIFLFDDSG
jgi:hypothetical protein